MSIGISAIGETVIKNRTLNVTSGASFVTSSTTDVQITGMSLTAPIVGKYLVLFTCQSAQSNNGQQNIFTVYYNGAAVTNLSFAQIHAGGSLEVVTITGFVDVTTASTNIDMRLRVSNNTATITNRTLTITRVL